MNGSRRLVEDDIPWMSPATRAEDPEPGHGWKPVLDGALRAQAARTIDAIVADLPAPAAVASPALSSGAAGFALLHATLAGARGRPELAQAASRHLDRAIELAGEVPLALGLYGGLCGVGWLLAHLRGSLVDPDDEDPFDELDASVREVLDAPWRGDFDLTRGLIGIGVYALERLPAPAAVHALSRILDHLEAGAETTADGTTWFRPPPLLAPAQRVAHPAGFYDTGLAHGAAGVIAFLARTLEAGVEPVRARRLLASAVSWLRAQARPAAAVPRFLTVIPPDQLRAATTETIVGRLAWCYGDLGIARALFVAGRAAAERAWTAAACELARACARRPWSDSLVHDATLCHGAAGIAHLFHRLYQDTGDHELADAARGWYAWLLAQQAPGRGIGGFLAWQPASDGRMGWHAAPGLLGGAAGIAIALLAAGTPVAPDWDRFLLL